MSAAKKAPKPLSAAALARAVAKQTGWAIVHVMTGKIESIKFSRAVARTLSRAMAQTRVVRVDLRIKGVRA